MGAKVAPPTMSLEELEEARAKLEAHRAALAAKAEQS